MSDENRSGRIRETLHRFMLTDRLHRAAIEAQLPKLGVHRSQHIVLMELSRNEVTPTQSELAKRFEISPAAMTVTLQKLEKSGLIEREPQEGNNRANTIRITESGRKTVNMTDELFHGVDEAMFSGISDEELERLIGCMERIEENLKSFSPEAVMREKDEEHHRHRRPPEDEDEEDEDNNDDKDGGK